MATDSLLPIYDDDTLAQLSELIDDGDASFLSELFESYLQTAEENIALLRENESQDVARRAAHTLKGSSLNVGAIRVAGLCKDLEMDLRESTVEDMAERIKPIEQQLTRVRQSYATTIENLAGS